MWEDGEFLRIGPAVLLFLTTCADGDSPSLDDVGINRIYRPLSGAHPSLFWSNRKKRGVYEETEVRRQLRGQAGLFALAGVSVSTEQFSFSFWTLDKTIETQTPSQLG